jgi:hypothetical protein
LRALKPNEDKKKGREKNVSDLKQFQGASLSWLFHEAFSVLLASKQPTNQPTEEPTTRNFQPFDQR